MNKPHDEKNFKASQKMRGHNPSPFGVQVIGDQTSVAMMGEVFAAKEASLLKQLRLNLLLYLLQSPLCFL